MSILDKKTIDYLAKELAPQVDEFLAITKSRGGVVPERNPIYSTEESIRDLLSSLEEDGDRTGTGRVFFELEVFEDGSGFSINVLYDMGHINSTMFEV